MVVASWRSMARGWESKAVESQIESAEAEHSASRRVQLSPEQLSRQRERESIELSRTRVLQDLASAINPKYRELLQRSLQYLNEQIATLDKT
jgi:adenylyl- and sulfurtransferase ThiI